MRKFTKEIAALIASAAVSAAIGVSPVYSEEIVQTAGVDTAPEDTVIEDVLVEGLMMPETTEATTMPPLAGEPLPPDEYIETTTTTIPPLAGVLTTAATTVPPLAGGTLPPDETVEPTEEIPPLAGDIVPADGDINGDGRLNVADAVKLQRFLSGKVIIDDAELIRADINRDGNVDVFDLVSVKRKLLEEIPVPPDETDPESQLREKYPEYFDLTGSKGLEVYVFQTVPDNYRCVLMEGTNRIKTDEEIGGLFSNSASVDEMKAILSYYGIPENDIFIIPWQSPVWEYCFVIDDAYCEKLREMFFGKDETVSPFFDSEEITFIGISSLPESAGNIREYSSSEKIRKVVSCLNELHLRKDYPENPDEYGGMTWVLRLGFENGDKKTIHLFGNMFYREEGGEWLRMNYDEAAAFESLVYDTPSD